jgi:ssDNA-binding Zn-finger/Zn-ribbon topoisomerase 1
MESVTAPQILRVATCPNCGSEDVFRYAAKGMVRYYRCRNPECRDPQTDQPARFKCIRVKRGLVPQCGTDESAGRTVTGDDRTDARAN